MFNIWVKAITIWTASSEFGTYRLCEQRRFRRACASAQSRQNLRCSLIQAVNQEELSDRKPDPWPLWMAGHAQLKFVMTECSKTQIRLTGLIWCWYFLALKLKAMKGQCQWKTKCKNHFVAKKKFCQCLLIAIRQNRNKLLIQPWIIMRRNFSYLKEESPLGFY